MRNTQAHRIREARELGYVRFRNSPAQRPWLEECAREGRLYIGVKEVALGYVVEFDYHPPRPAGWPEDFWVQVLAIIRSTAVDRVKMAIGGGWGRSPVLRDYQPLLSYLREVAVRVGRA